MRSHLKWWLLLMPRLGEAIGLLLCYLCLFALAHALGGQRLERAAGRLNLALDGDEEKTVE